MSLYGEALYRVGELNTDFFLQRLIRTQPPPYVTPENRDFLERFLLPTAEDLGRINQVLDLLDTYFYPESAPEEWLDWLIIEVMGWKLIPEGYPVARKRRLLKNIHAHYKRRFTVGRNPNKTYVTDENGTALDKQLNDAESGAGIRLLLREFGVVAMVIDRPLYVGSYVGQWGISSPLQSWIRILYFEPWETPRNTFVGNYVGFTYAYKTKPLVTKDFVRALLEWSRPAGTVQLVEWVTQNTRPRIEVLLDTQPVQQEIIQPINQEPLTFEG